MVDVLMNLENLEIQPNFGPDTDVFYVTTDVANMYLLQLIKEKNREEGLNFALTESIVLPNTQGKTIKKLCALLSSKYSDLAVNKGAEGIYTVLNVAPSLDKTAHQNWLFYDVNNQRIIRFEPNGRDWDQRSSGKAYKIDQLMNCVASNLGIDWEYSDNAAINTFNGCRATSTILALMNLLNLDTSIFEGKDQDYFRSLAFQVTQSMNRCAPRRSLRRSRRGKTSLDVLLDPSLQKIFQNISEEDEIVVQGDRNIQVFDPTTKSIEELKTYLRDQARVEVSPLDQRIDLLRKVLEYQNSIIVI